MSRRPSPCAPAPSSTSSSSSPSLDASALPACDDLDAVALLVEDREPPPRPVAAPEPRRRPQRARADVLPTPARRRGRKDARGDENLSDYLSSLGRIALLTADDEQRLARELRDAELGAWLRLLQRPVAVQRLLDDVTVHDDSALLARLHAFAQAQRDAHDIEARTVEELADALRAHDDERTLVHDALAAVAAQARTCEHSRVVERDVQALRRRALHVRNAFVRANLRLVVSVARRFHHHRLPLIDLIQEGNLGLIKSVHRFDHRRGFRFSTYAHWWIRQAIERAIMNKGAQVRLPVHVFDARREVAKATRDLHHKLGRDPTNAELSVALGMPADKLDEVLAAVPREPLSIHDPIGDDDDRNFGDLIAADGPAPDDEVAHAHELHGVKRALRTLSPMEVDIITRRFGLAADDDETLEAIGRSYNLSRERVRQIQVQGLKKIQTLVEERPTP